MEVKTCLSKLSRVGVAMAGVEALLTACAATPTTKLISR